jgi:hypothetical protein
MTDPRDADILPREVDPVANLPGARCPVMNLLKDAEVTPDVTWATRPA